MSVEIFLLELLIVSTLTGLTTEAIKSWLTERDKPYYANALAGYVAVALSILVSVLYMVLTETAFNVRMAAFLVGLIFLSWLSAMVGYDKVVQAIAQFRAYSPEK